MLTVLVICTGNSCRSVLGEALLNHLGAGRLQAFSAGSKPIGKINTGALATLARHNLPITGYTSQAWTEFADQKIDIAITVCDNAAGETCPIYLNSAAKVHWGLVDPAHIEGTEAEKIAAFEFTFKLLEQRITNMLELPLESMSSEVLSIQLNALVTE